MVTSIFLVYRVRTQPVCNLDAATCISSRSCASGDAAVTTRPCGSRVTFIALFPCRSNNHLCAWLNVIALLHGLVQFPAAGSRTEPVVSYDPSGTVGTRLGEAERFQTEGTSGSGLHRRHV